MSFKYAYKSTYAFMYVYVFNKCKCLFVAIWFIAFPNRFLDFQMEVVA